MRVAGNFATDDGIASFEYAVQVLGTPLLMVLGHEACGAVSAAIQSIKESTTLPGHLPALVKSISPAVEAVLDKPGDTLGNAIRGDVVRNVEKLKTAEPILSKAVEEKKLRVVGEIVQPHQRASRVDDLNEEGSRMTPTPFLTSNPDGFFSA